MDANSNRHREPRFSPLALLLIWAVQLYRRVISPLMVSRCRYSPSCSAYAVEALAKHGAFKGTWLAARRISRCHPWHEGGWDPVPDGVASRISNHA